MHVPRKYLVDERAARWRGIDHGSVGSFDACSAGADRQGMTPTERAGHAFAHDLNARDGFNGFAPGVWAEVQSEMIALLFEAIASAFARWRYNGAPVLPGPEVFESERASWAPKRPAKAADRRAPRQPRGARKAMVENAVSEKIDGALFTVLPTGGKHERRVTR